MSRVLTCPPLVFARNHVGVQNLVESTKLKRITLDSKKAHRIEKKEKKEKRKEKKETKREKSHKHSIKATDNHHKLIFLPSKKVSDESDSLEKSGLTDELEEPQKHLGYLSDGSQNSKKRIRDDSPPAVESLIKAAPVAGKPLRIRMVFKKPKEEVPTLPREAVVCSTTVAKSLSHQDVITSSISSSKTSELEKNLPSTSIAAIDETKKRKKHRSSKEDQYNALFDGWTPPSMCIADASSNDNGDYWLFGNKTQEVLKPKAAVKVDDDTMMRPGDSSWPRAQFLSEVGIYSLPYTVPF
ncbi:DNA ligase [Arabidopsis thaliana]|nr:DNA ligase [Arabidopsis thaliana]AEE35766.1 DNA ligase [Arabidopsis thaliana]|eukprot:NP_177714.2 DNA ligase [Arabidopsis thaliana]